MMKHAALAVALALIIAGCRGQQPAAVPASQADPMLQKLTTMTARFAPVDIAADISTLAPNERQSLAKLIEAAKVFDTLFFRQVWAGNETMLLDLTRDTSEVGRARLHYFMLNKGPWSRLDHNEPFVAGAPPKPPEGNFYPAGATKEEIEAWIKTLPPAERTRATGFFTTIRRGLDGKFIGVPYRYGGSSPRSVRPWRLIRTKTPGGDRRGFGVVGLREQFLERSRRQEGNVA